jgi:PAS domain S-box-containing protein
MNPNDDFDTIKTKYDSALERNADLTNALHKLATFQVSLLSLRKCKNVEDTLDIMESLLEEIIDFTFFRLYLKDKNSPEGFALIREMCPQEYDASWDFVKWTINKQELSLIPIPNEDETNDDINSLLILPMIGHSKEVGVLLLWVEADMTSFTPEHSTLLNMLAGETASVIEQITLRRKVEDSRAELADILENIPLGIVAIDNNKNITQINGTSEFIFNTRKDEAIGKPLPTLVSPKAFSQIKSLFNEDNGAISGGEVEVEFNEEIQEPFGVSCAPIRMASEAKYIKDDESEELYETTGYVLVCRDLKLSREVAKLRELDSMKNDFLSLVSHELRTPLTSIMAYSETLLMDGIIDTEEERKEYLEIIHSEGERLSRLINDVLDLTKMEAGKMDFIYEVIEIQAPINTAKNAVFSLADQKSMEMVFEIEEDLPKVRADHDKIVQVITNLYSNAIKFTDEKGRITTKAYLTTAKEDESEKVIEVSVTDTGMGIAQEDIHKVFSKFEMVEKIDHHSIGTGLGMPICKQIIEDGHAGKIWLESELGVGTTFFFQIPVTS